MQTQRAPPIIRVYVVRKGAREDIEPPNHGAEQEE